MDFRPVASACATALDQRHPVYMRTVEGYARRGNERSDGMRVELWAEERRGRGENLRPSVPAVARFSLFCFTRVCMYTRDFQFASRGRRENYETISKLHVFPHRFPDRCSYNLQPRDRVETIDRMTP